MFCQYLRIITKFKCSLHSLQNSSEFLVSYILPNVPNRVDIKSYILKKIKKFSFFCSLKWTELTFLFLIHLIKGVCLFTRRLPNSLSNWNSLIKLQTPLSTMVKHGLNSGVFEYLKDEAVTNLFLYKQKVRF